MKLDDNEKVSCEEMYGIIVCYKTIPGLRYWFCNSNSPIWDNELTQIPLRMCWGSFVAVWNDRDHSRASVPSHDPCNPCAVSLWSAVFWSRARPAGSLGYPRSWRTAVQSLITATTANWCTSSCSSDDKTPHPSVQSNSSSSIWTYSPRHSAIAKISTLSFKARMRNGVTAHLGVIPEMCSSRIAYNTFRKVTPDRVGKVQFVCIEYCILIEWEHSIRLYFLVGQESLRYARPCLRTGLPRWRRCRPSTTASQGNDMQRYMIGGRPAFFKWKRPICSPQNKYL